MVTLEGGMPIESRANFSQSESGTLGCFVKINGDIDNIYFLTCYHVVIGKERRAREDLIKLIDSGIDVGHPTLSCCGYVNNIGKVVKTPLPIMENLGTDKVKDYALVKLNKKRLHNNKIIFKKWDIPDFRAGISVGMKYGMGKPYEPFARGEGGVPWSDYEIGNITNPATDLVQLNDVVWKIGARTGLTRGRVNHVGDINFEIATEIPYQVFGDHGDSGAMVFKKGVNGQESKIIGMLYESNKAIKINQIITDFNIDILLTSTGASMPTLGNTLNDYRFSIPILNEEFNFQHFITYFQSEIINLIQHHRNVKLIWHRYQGPAFLNYFIAAISDEKHSIPNQIEDISLSNLLIQLSIVLKKFGSTELSQTLERKGLEIVQFVSMKEDLLIYFRTQQ